MYSNGILKKNKSTLPKLIASRTKLTLLPVLLHSGSVGATARAERKAFAACRVGGTATLFIIYTRKGVAEGGGALQQRGQTVRQSETGTAGRTST